MHIVSRLVGARRFDIPFASSSPPWLPSSFHGMHTNFGVMPQNWNVLPCCPNHYSFGCSLCCRMGLAKIWTNNYCNGLHLDGRRLLFASSPLTNTHQHTNTDEFRSKVACENDSIQLVCNPYSRIAIYSASFGRTEYESIQCSQPQGVMEECKLLLLNAN